MAKYEEFLIGDLETGLFTAKEAWVGPHDAFPVLVNACVDKGVLRKRKGYSIIVPSGLDSLPVTGINRIGHAGYNELILCTTRRPYHIHAETP